MSIYAFGTHTGNSTMIGCPKNWSPFVAAVYCWGSMRLRQISHTGLRGLDINQSLQMCRNQRRCEAGRIISGQLRAMPQRFVYPPLSLEKLDGLLTKEAIPADPFIRVVKHTLRRGSIGVGLWNLFKVFDTVFDPVYQPRYDDAKSWDLTFRVCEPLN